MTTKFVSITVNTGIDMASTGSRVDRGKSVAGKAVHTSAYLTDAGFKASIDSYVKSTQHLETAQLKVSQLEDDLKAARDDRDKIQKESDKLYVVCVGYVEHHSQAPADISSYGFVALQRRSPNAAIPELSDFRITYDVAKKLLKFHAVKDTRRPIRIEWCPDPLAPSPNWQRTGGSAAVQTLPDWPKGPASFRACIEGAKALGPWFGPVTIVVP